MKQTISRRARHLALGVAASAVASLGLAGAALADSSYGGGSFVIGDQNNLNIGSQVDFWGAQWWKENPLSTGSAPASFKGYAVNGGWCGDTWSSLPGDSSNPPAALDNTISVIVSSSITKSGRVISGDVQDIVLVAPDPGYAADPGHPGSGTIVGFVCGNGLGAGDIRN